MLPTLWRYDIEIDEETYLSNCMVDLLVGDANGYAVVEPAHRKWMISGGFD